MEPLELAWLEFREDPDVGVHAFVAVALPLLVQALPRDPRDPHRPLTAATDAVLDLAEHPDRYDPARGLSLFRYLRMAAHADLRNLWAREGRHDSRREPGDPVELLAGVGNTEQEAPTMLEDFPSVATAIAELPAEERAALALMRQGERATAAFAAALRLGDRPPAELAAEVKRAKDRIIARLKRAGEERMTPDPVTFAAERAAARPAFLAYALARYAAAEQLDDAALAARLGCPPDVLAHVKLCRMPPADPDGFRAAVARVGERFGVNPDPLGDAVRLGQNLAALADAPDDAPAEAGYLLAARDRPPR